VGRGADEVAKGGQELQEDGSGIGFGVRGKATDGEAGKTVEGGIGQCGRPNSLRWGSGRGLGIFVVIVVFGFLGKTGVFFKGGLFLSEGLVGRRGGWRHPLPGLEGEQLPAAALYGGEGGQGRGSADGVGCGCHNTTLVRFRI
jgi:hypothetical protein